jgi:hypothetical protein
MEIGLSEKEIKDLLEKGYIFEIRPNMYKFFDRDEPDVILRGFEDE